MAYKDLPVRHSAGKSKTSSFSEKYSDKYSHMVSSQGYNNLSATQGYHSVTSTQGYTSSYYKPHNPINQYESEEQKIQRKNSLRDILRNRKIKEEVNKSVTTLQPSSSYVQKYYRKPNVNATTTTVYKENRVGKGV